MSTGYMLNRWQRDESVSWLPGVKFKDGLARVALGHQNDAHQETKKLFLVFWRWRPRRIFDECDVEAAQIFWLNQQRKVFQLSKKSYLVRQSQNGLAQLFNSFSVRWRHKDNFWMNQCLNVWRQKMMREWGLRFKDWILNQKWGIKTDRVLIVFSNCLVSKKSERRGNCRTVPTRYLSSKRQPQKSLQNLI